MSDHDWHRPMEDNPYCDVATASLPPMYQWTCSKCGKVAYRDCNEGEPPRDGCASKSSNDELNAYDFGRAGIGITSAAYEKLIAELEAELEEARNTFEVIDWWTDENGDRHVITTNGEDFCHYVKGDHAEAVNAMLRDRDGRIAELEAELRRSYDAQGAKAEALTMRSVRIAELESLVRDMGKAFIHDNCYRWCEAQAPCNLITTGECQYRERMHALGLEVDA